MGLLERIHGLEVVAKQLSVYSKLPSSTLSDSEYR